MHKLEIKNTKEINDNKTLQDVRRCEILLRMDCKTKEKNPREKRERERNQLA